MRSFYSKVTESILDEYHRLSWRDWCYLGLLLCGCGASSICLAEVSDKYTLHLSGDSLAEVLQELAEQANVQLVYEQKTVATQPGVTLNGQLSIAAVMDRLLRDTHLQWRFINDRTVAIYAEAVKPHKAVKPPVIAAGTNSPLPPANHEVASLPDVDVNASQLGWGNGESDALGFAKPILETPRSISYISGDTIDVFSLSAVEDLLRLVPGVFTTTRFGVQGSVDIRNVAGDSYFRGMKRLTLQGHGRSVFSATDSIEIVGGGTSPLYGLGKIGGYTNVVPKSGRARAGTYLEQSEGFVQVIGGEYQRRELSAGFGGPVSPALTTGKQGGYYLYGLVEDSGSYTQGVPVGQKLFQVATSVDNVVADFRLETGINYQNSTTAGALTGRLTQDMVDRNRYISGSPLVNLDLNGNGTIGYLEMNRASPVRGNLSSYNQPLQQVFAWPTDAQGQPLPLNKFPTVSGIPQSMYDYLESHPEADPTGLLRAQGVGGPTPTSNYVPVGMVLDPRTVQYATLNPRHSSAFEKKLDGNFLTAYIDLINDTDSNHTMKNQLFFDSMNQYKSSNQPFSQIQDVYVVEDKFTASHRFPRLFGGLSMNALVSANLRNTVSKGKRTLADYGNHRADAASADWNDTSAGMTDNTTFTSANDNTSLNDDGLPWRNIYRTEFSEMGIGVMFDVDAPFHTNVVLGGRYDRSRASNTDYAGRFNVNTGTALNPGAYINSDDTATNWDGGPSWSLSVSHAASGGLRPYLTWSRSSIMLDGNNNSLVNAVIQAGHIGYSQLKEAGLKGAWRGGKVTLATSVYEQGRIDVDADDDTNIVNAYASSTTTRGWQTEFRWQPFERLLTSFYALQQVTRYTPNVGGVIQVDARTLGFKDVLDANGNVVYPAEAFLYGGRAFIVLPDNMKQYERKQGNPEVQAGAAAVYGIDKHWLLSTSANYLASTCSGRLCLVKLPSSLVVDVGVGYSIGDLSLKLDVNNIANERYYRARTGDTLGDNIAQTMPGRSWQVTAKLKF